MVACLVLPGCGTRCADHINDTRLSGLAPLQLVVRVSDREGRGTATPLADGTIVTAAHVVERGLPIELDGIEINQIDYIRRGRPRPIDIGQWHTTWEGDWVHMRLGPMDDHPGWRPAETPLYPEPGEVLLIRGYPSSSDPKEPILCEVRARVVAAPSWVKASDEHLIYAVPADSASNIDHSGMSGGPVLLKDKVSGHETLVGIYVGRMYESFLGFHVGVKLMVIHPWPPADKSASQ